MYPTIPRLMLVLSLASGVAASGAASAASGDEAATRRHFAALLAGPQPKLAELTMFLSMMPKGGDLHHHYSGAIYAEQYLDWVEQQHYCINKTNYRIETEAAVIDAERAKSPPHRVCLTAAEVIADNGLYRELLQRWSVKDFANHGALQSPPDLQFFDTFAYFNPVSSGDPNPGLQRLKQRAIDENLGYIETMLLRAPNLQNAEFDQALVPALDGAALTAKLDALSAALERDARFNDKLGKYVARVEAASAGIDDQRFTMRYQAYVLRLQSPSLVFSSMLAAFKAASQSPLIVGVNLVGAENEQVAMRDYRLHMRMFGFLKARYPKVKLALHAGELALGMVEPEGLRFHIRDAIDVAGAGRIGHGIDLAHETDAPAILRAMRSRGIAVEINLSSNDFIAGVRDSAHPVTLYRRYGVPFVISTDDPGVSRGTLSGEYVLFASRYRPDYAEVKRLSFNSVRYSFLAEADKRRLTRQLEQRFAAFEARIAALARAGR